MLRVSYGLVGVFEAFSGFLVYFVIMADHGFLPMRLFFLRKDWDAKGVNDLQDSYGQEWVSGVHYLCFMPCALQVFAYLYSLVVGACRHWQEGALACTWKCCKNAFVH